MLDQGSSGGSKRPCRSSSTVNYVEESVDEGGDVESKEGDMAEEENEYDGEDGIDKDPTP